MEGEAINSLAEESIRA